MNLQRREEIRVLIADQNIEDPQALTDCRNALAELLAHIDTLEQTAVERVIADGKVPSVVMPELDADLIHPLIQWTPGFRVKMEETAQAINAWFRKHARAIPADRVLGEGMVQVDRDEFDSATRWTFNGIDIHKVEHKEGFWFAVRRGNSCMSRSGEWDLEPLPSSRTPEFFAEFRFDSFRSALMALRANQGGAAT